MKSYTEQLTHINSVYYISTDVSRLQTELQSLDALIDDPNLYEDKRDNAKALRIRLQAKIFLLVYLDGFLPDAYRQAIDGFTEGLQLARKCNYDKTVQLLENFLQIVERLDSVLNRLAAYKTALYGQGVDEDMCDKALAAVSSAKEGLTECNFAIVAPQLFVGDVARLAAEFVDNCQQQFVELKQTLTVRRVSPYIKDVSDCKLHNTYFPLPEYDEGGKSNMLILSTPLPCDARLFAVNQCQSAKLFCIDASGLADKSNDFSLTVLDYVLSQNAACIVENANLLTVEQSDELLLAAMRLGKRGARIYFTDTCGDAQLYKRAIDLTGDNIDLSILDASVEYVTMPNFKDVRNILETMEMATPANSTAILQKMPFLGFDGLNKIVKAFVARDPNWQQTGMHISKYNRKAVLNYMQKLSASTMVIDDGWGDFSQYNKIEKEAAQNFNYDFVPDVDKRNIRLIVESNESVFAKCGMVARYCTIGNMDNSVWLGFDHDERERRLRLAVRAVYQILRFQVTEDYPKVELLKKLSNGTAGGLCVDGGKLIQFEEKSTNGLEWTWGCIVHECFHTMQRYLIKGGWTDWYFDNFGITPGRVMLWQETRCIYDGNTESEIYKVHMYEGDARAFEKDCLQAMHKAWGSMNFI